MDFKYLVLLFLLHCTYNAYAGYTDCEHPPTIANGKAELEVDESGTNVMGLYSCNSGFQIQGESTIYCNTDTDEWQGQLPSCTSESGGGSAAPAQPASATSANVKQDANEIEVVDEPEATHMEISNTETPPPASIAIATESTNIQTTTAQQKRRRKPKLENIAEDPTIDEAFGSQLDLSCVGEKSVAAPPINDSYIHRYDRLRKGKNIFLVATYECVENFALENPEQNRMYCSNGGWIGTTPVCISTLPANYTDNDADYNNGNGNGDEDDVEEEEEEEDGNEGGQGSQTGVVARHGTSNNVATDNDINGQTVDQNGNEVETSETVGERVDNAIDVPQTNVQPTQTPVPTGTSPPEASELVCGPGFFVDPFEQRCVDINECYNPEISDSCEFGCQNTNGSYYCLPSPTTPKQEGAAVESTEQAKPVDLSPIKACGDGFRKDAANNCIDIDECVEQDTGCQHCKNIDGTYECICPDGFQLAKDEKTCEDIDECAMYTEYVYDDNDTGETEHPRSQSICSFECVNTLGSWFCKCPENHHLKADKRTCERDLCQHLGEIETNKTKCSHECIDEAEGYRCICPPGLQLTDDQKTCVPFGASVTNEPSNDCTEEQEQQCSPGECQSLGGEAFQCSCPKGYAPQSNRCIDFDECLLGTHNCSHGCRNIDGAYLCECPPDLQLSPDQHTCATADVCLQNPGICGNLFCKSSEGNYECVCPKGKQLSQDGKDCVVADLCQTENGGCSDICNVVNDHVVCECPSGYQLAGDGRTCQTAAGAFCAQNNGGCAQVCNADYNRCECYPGFQTVDNGKTCIDVNECQNENGGCAQQCVNSDGGFECTCFPGFTHDRGTDGCVDVDECLLANGNCDHQCENTVGSYKCSCRSGFRSVGNHCEDVNECENNNGNCSHTCVNLNGSYQCSCPEGQFLVNDDHTCDYLNECEINNGGCSYECNYSNGVIQCVCPKGFKLDDDIQKNCVDIDECLINKGGCSHECENLNGTHVCKCNEGFQLGSDGNRCIDLDECIENNGNCSNICINLFGSYSCACEAGFELDKDKHTCVDIDECENSINDCSHFCNNVPGTYECSCPTGYNLSRDHFNCEDINECLTNNNCAIASDCVNTIGSFYCNCPEGHERSPINNTCVDINECNDSSLKRCSHECENTVGAFNCLCPTGMKLAEDTVTCIDINECDTKISRCSHGCENTEGSFKCLCPRGYELDVDLKTCKEINECAINNGGCEQLCTNLDGSYKCECVATGYRLAEDGHHCIHSDPCAYKNGGCAHVCEPLNGKPQCFCYKGFELNMTDKTSCIDIDECQLDHDCESKCINTIGSYKCDCPSGYRLNEIGLCVDIDECELFNGGCSPHSQCINFKGSFRCICPTGYKLARDRVTCMEIKDNCQSTPTPENGDVRCTRSRHRTQLFYKTKCTITCNEGYRLIGPSVKYCNGSGGTWDDGESVCVPTTCPGLPRPAYGTLTPPDCFFGKINPGEVCSLKCPPGFKPAGADFVVCDGNQHWSPDTELGCIPVNDHVLQPTGANIGAQPAPSSHTAQPHPSVQYPAVPHQVLSPQQAHGNQGATSAGKRVQQGQTYTHGQVDIQPPSPSVVSRTGAGRSLAQPEPRLVQQPGPRVLQQPVPIVVQQPGPRVVQQPGPIVVQQPGPVIVKQPVLRPVGLPRPILPPIQTPLSIVGQNARAQSRRVGPTSIVGSAIVPSPITGQIIPITGQAAPITAQAAFKPFIKCPQDTTIVLPKNKKTVEVNLEQPKTNVDWRNFVDAHPNWAKNLKVQLGVGIHTFAFRARSPTASNVNDVCQTVITVKEASVGPEVVYCPPTVEIQLQPNELLRPIVWREPAFKSQRPLKQVFKSNASGTKFGAGTHRVTYIATDTQNQKATCEFTITIRPSAFARLTNVYQGNRLENRLDNHDSFLICPGKPTLKLDTSFAIQIPNGCFVKNVRINHHNRHHRRHSLGSNNMLRYYSSWDQPNFLRSSNYNY